MRLGKVEDDAAALGAVGKYLEGVNLPSGKKATQRFVEAFDDKPQVLERCLKNWDDAWKDLPPERRNLRIKLASRRVAELKELLRNDLSDNALEAFTKLQKRLFTKEGVDSDVYPQFIELFNEGNGVNKTKLKAFLEDSKANLDNSSSDIRNGGGDPPNRGRAGAVTSKTYPVGTILTRYGNPDVAKFLAEGDPPFWSRSLPDSSESNPYRRYRVAQPFTADSSRVAPWFGKPGGSVQVDLGNGATTVQTLLNNGTLEPL